MEENSESRLIVLNSGHSSAAIDANRGATVMSLKFSDGAECLYTAKVPGPLGDWPGAGIPICFPFAGRVWHKNEVGKYLYPGSTKVHSMPIHGFAANSRWTIVEKSEDSATFELKDSPATLEVYPFKFLLRVTYKLSSDSFKTSMQIESLDSVAGTMPVSAGFHPYFALPGISKSFEDYTFSSHLNQETAVTAAGGAGASNEMAASPWSKKLSDPFLHNKILGSITAIGDQRNQKRDDAEITANAEGTSLIVHRDTPNELRHMVLWAKPDLGFFCVEPWMALPDGVHNGGGCIFMKPTQVLHLGFSIRRLNRRAT